MWAWGAAPRDTASGRGGTAPAGGTAGRGGRGGVMIGNPFTEFDNVVSRDLIPFIDATYRTIADRDHRALAGLSMGGAEAMRIGVNHLELFTRIGLFSPAIGNLDPATSYDGKLADAAAINKQLRLLWIGIGTEDSLHDGVKTSHENLDRTGIQHVWVETARRPYLDCVAQVPGGFCAKAVLATAGPARARGAIGRLPVYTAGHASKDDQSIARWNSSSASKTAWSVNANCVGP